VLKARLKGLPAAPSSDVLFKARAFPDACAEVPAKATVSGDVLEVVIPPFGVDREGAVWIVARVDEINSGMLAFVKSFHGEIDLGEMAVGKAAPVLVAGKVLTRGRKPAAEAWTCIVTLGVGNEAIAFPDFGVATDAAGAFSIPGYVWPPDKYVCVGTIGEWFMPAPIAFVRGATTVELVATNTVDVRGEVSLPSDGTWEDLVVGVYPIKGSIPESTTVVGAKDARRVQGGVEFAASPSYELKGLPPGDYALRLSIPGLSKPLASERASLDVAFDVAKLPRLVALTAVRRAQVRVVAADGRALPGARLWARETGTRGSFREVTLAADGAAKVPFVGAAVELVACAPATDFATTTARNGAEATLTPPAAKTTQVTVKLPDDAPRASGDLRLELRIAWRAPVDAAERAVDVRYDDKDARKLDDVRVEFPATGAAVATIPRPGWYLLSLRAGSGDAALERPVGPLRVEGAGPRVVTLPVSAGDVAKLFEAVAKRRR
jgi:hypothetical protein